MRLAVHRAATMACIHRLVTLACVKTTAALRPTPATSSPTQTHSPSNRSASIRLSIKHTENQRQQQQPSHTNPTIVTLCPRTNKHCKPTIHTKHKHLISVHYKPMRWHIHRHCQHTINQYKWKQYSPVIQHTIGAITFKMVFDTRNRQILMNSNL